MSTALPDKQFFKIGEAADIVGVKAHVLRYWESEFAGVRPLKTRGAHRMYRRADVELLCLIRRLLYEEGFTIPGAKKRVAELRRERAGALDGPAKSLDARASRELSLRAELLSVRSDLVALLEHIDHQGAPAEPPPPKQVTVTSVVPKTVLIERTRG
jgi:DNA-binding transcriptional MerR regulator